MPEMEPIVLKHELEQKEAFERVKNLPRALLSGTRLDLQAILEKVVKPDQKVEAVLKDIEALPGLEIHEKLDALLEVTGAGWNFENNESSWATFRTSSDFQLKLNYQVKEQEVTITSNDIPHLHISLRPKLYSLVKRKAEELLGVKEG